MFDLSGKKYPDRAAEPEKKKQNGQLLRKFAREREEMKCVYAGPDQMGRIRFDRLDAEMTGEQAGQAMRKQESQPTQERAWRQPEEQEPMKCVYAGPGIMDKEPGRGEMV